MEQEEKKQRPSWQEIQEKKINLVKERGSRVMRVNSPIGSTMFSILRQFDMAYANFKGRLGEMGGITYEEGAALMEEGREIVMEFSNFTAKLCRKVNFRYYAPHEIKEYIEWLETEPQNVEDPRGEEDPSLTDS
jgi:hypothetical protein